MAIAVGLSLPTNHDEYQYIAAAHLVPELRLYADVFYSQTPYFPWALAGWQAVTGWLVESPYMAARLFNIAWSLIFLVTLLNLAARLAPLRLLAVGICAASVGVGLMELPIRVARNDMMPLALATLALLQLARACWLDAEAGRQRVLLHLGAGLLLAAAVGTKLSYAHVAAVAVLHAILDPQLPWGARWKLRVLPLVAGGVLGAVPMLAMAAASPENFLYATTEFHQTHHHWASSATPEAYEAIGSLAVRAYVLFRVLATLPYLLLALVFAACIAVALLARHRAGDPEEVRLWSICLLCVGTVLASIPMFIMPKPLHAQYVAPVVPFVAIAAASATALMRRRARAARLGDGRAWLFGAAALLIGGALVQAFVAPRLGPISYLRFLTAMSLRDPSGGPWLEHGGLWVAPHMRRVAGRLQDVLGPPQPGLRIATVMNTYPIEAGFGIHRELAGAPFFYQTNDRIPPALVERLRGTSPELAPAWLERAQVRAVLVGYMPALDAPFRAHARRHGFLCFTVDLSGSRSDREETGAGELWVAPELARAAPDCGTD
ncbi:hypothetical protein [Falsiroseomonas oryzae]|uniref:hypothetical protein n=1 Tax=Falsiroseomonas oryzae TaxID=2766473 RepID=UPI0022EA56B4|nr:hypothetical protein [Roseomonas sp. MO-31]